MKIENRSGNDNKKAKKNFKDYILNSIMTELRLLLDIQDGIVDFQQSFL